MAVLGCVVGVHGVRGWVKVRSWTRPAENLLDYPHWWLQRDSAWERVAVREGRPHGKGLAVALGDVNDREMARERLVGRNIAVPRAQLPPAEPDEIYWSDLEGMRVETVNGVPLGRVDHLIETGANDVLVVRGERERLIPFTDIAVREVDLGERCVRVDWDPDF